VAFTKQKILDYKKVKSLSNIFVILQFMQRLCNQTLKTVGSNPLSDRDSRT